MSKSLGGCPADVFGDSEESGQVARLMVAACVLHTIQLLHLRTIDDDTAPFAQGHLLVLYCLTVSILKEAIDAFRAAKQHLEVSHPEGILAVERILDAYGQGKTDTNALYGSVLYRIRNTAGFHWKISRILEVLRGMKSVPDLLIFESYDPHQRASSRFVAGDAILSRLVLDDLQTMDEISEEFKNVAAITREFHVAVEAILSEWLIQRPVKITESGKHSTDR